MGKAVCATTHEEMQAKLAQRCQEAARKVKVDVKPQPERRASQLVWKKVSEWCIESACGRYRIEKFAPGEDVLAESVAAHKYRCLKLVPAHWFWQFEVRDDPQSARAACEADLNGHDAQRSGSDSQSR